MSVSADDFRNALSRFPSGVNVVTTKDADGRPHGITVSAFCSVSLAPPLVLICIEKSTVSHDAFADSEVFVVNMLRKSQQHLSEQFAAPAVDKFEDVDFRSGIDGVPVLKQALASIECRLRNAFDGGDHTIYVGEVETISVGEGEPLVYHQGDYRKLES
ncbi:MAG TPA: flavin reductase family protein [Pyrinomonadaceae bacterium]|nr:flavin reductase family protein [Pyrinomonadaceae bacterium]